VDVTVGRVMAAPGQSLTLPIFNPKKHYSSKIGRFTFIASSPSEATITITGEEVKECRDILHLEISARVRKKSILFRPDPFIRILRPTIAESRFHFHQNIPIDRLLFCGRFLQF
jgi:hypothetical protein